MNVLLDENITPKAKEYLERLGNNVESIHSLGLRGADDIDVFKIAKTNNRVLLTHNGRHFIIQIPPREKGVTHSGLLWLKYEMNRANAEVICKKVNDLFIEVTSLKDAIWVMKKLREEIKFEKWYPDKNIIIFPITNKC